MNRLFSFIPRLRGPDGILVVSTFLNFAGFTFILPVLPFSVGQFVPADQIATWVSLLIAAFAACSFLSAPILGAVSDRFGRRPVLILSLIGSALGFVVFGIGGSYAVLMIGRIIDGLTAGNISTVYACVADLHEPKDRGRFYGLLGAAGGLGFMMGPVAGGLLGEIWLGLPAFAAAGLGFLNALWVTTSLPETRKVEPRDSAVRQRMAINPFGQLLAIVRLPRLGLLLATGFAFVVAATLFQSNTGVMLKDRLGFNTAAIGFALFGVGVMDILSQGLAAPRLLPLLGERRLAILGLLINAAGFALYAVLALQPSITLLVAALVVLNLGDGLFQPAQNAMISASAPPGRQGEVQGANQAQQSLARIIGPLGSAVLYTITPAGPYLASFAIILLGTVVLTRLDRGRTSLASQP